MALWKAEGIDLYCLTADSFPDIYAFPESVRNKLIGCYSDGTPQSSIRQVPFGNSTDPNSAHEIDFYTFPTGEKLSLFGGKQGATQIQVSFRYHYNPDNYNDYVSAAMGPNSDCTCLCFVISPESANPNIYSPNILIFSQGILTTPGLLVEKLHSYTWTTDFGTNPITYIPINSTLSGPESASSGETVNVSVSFPDGYIYQESGTQVYNKDGVIPFTYADGTLTFTMP